MPARIRDHIRTAQVIFIQIEGVVVTGLGAALDDRDHVARDLEQAVSILDRRATRFSFSNAPPATVIRSSVTAPSTLTCAGTDTIRTIGERAGVTARLVDRQSGNGKG